MTTVPGDPSGSTGPNGTAASSTSPSSTSPSSTVASGTIPSGAAASSTGPSSTDLRGTAASSTIPSSTIASRPVPGSTVAGIVLAAGEGQRLRPLTESLPKALCPVGNIPLLDRALARLAGLGLTGPADVAVNAAYLSDQIVRHVGQRAHVSVEPDGPLGTSGGVARLRQWLDGRAALIGNADGYLADPARDPGKDIAALLEGWSGETVRMLTRPVPPGATGGFSGRRFAGFSLLPWRYVRDLPQGHGDLVRTAWRPAEAAGELELIAYDGVYIDTGTPADYLAANLHAAGGASIIDPTAEVTGTVTESVIGPQARIHGTATRSVIWPTAEVTATETLTNAIRAPGGLTITPA